VRVIRYYLGPCLPEGSKRRSDMSIKDQTLIRGRTLVGLEQSVQVSQSVAIRLLLVGGGGWVLQVGVV